jgi:hypothetical protein
MAASHSVVAAQHGTRKARQQQQQQQQLQGCLLVAQAALSLLLTITKLPHVMQSAEVCAHLATCITCLQGVATAGPSAGNLLLPLPPPQQQQQEQGQQQGQQQQQSQPAQPSQSQLLRSAPQQELQRAVLVLAGRYLLLAGFHMQRLAAERSTPAFAELAMLLLGPNPATASTKAGHVPAPVPDDSLDDSSDESAPLRKVIKLLLQHCPKELSDPEHSVSISTKVPEYFQNLAAWHKQLEVNWANRHSRSLAEDWAQMFVMDTLLLVVGMLETHLRGWRWVYEMCTANTDENNAQIQQLKGELIALQVQGGRLSTKDRLKQKVLLGQLQTMQKTLSDLGDTLLQLQQPQFFKAAGRFAQVLQHVDALLCSHLPSRFCCNHPACSSLSTASEGFLLVRGLPDGQQEACAGTNLLHSSEVRLKIMVGLLTQFGRLADFLSAKRCPSDCSICSCAVCSVQRSTLLVLLTTQLLVLPPEQLPVRLYAAAS